MTPAQKVEAYITLRNHKKQATDAFKQSLTKVEEAMEKLEGELLSALNEDGADSLSCKAGTVYKRTETSVTIQDAEAFKEFADDHDGVVDIRANKTAVRELMEQGIEVPGVKVTSIVMIGVRSK
jgi:hypothetical protein